MKSSCNDITLYMQHHLSSDSTTDSSASARSLSVNPSSRPIASASATHLSASFFTWDFLHCLHFPFTFPFRLVISSSHTDTRCDVQMWFAPGFSDPDKYRWDSRLFIGGSVFYLCSN